MASCVNLSAAHFVATEEHSMTTSLPPEPETSRHNESELIHYISQELPVEIWRQYRGLVKKLHVETLTSQEHRVLIGLADEIEMNHARRLGLVLELARLRGTSLEAQIQELRFPRHLYEQETSD